jgi:hypothetical protein
LNLGLKVRRGSIPEARVLAGRKQRAHYAESM